MKIINVKLVNVLVDDWSSLQTKMKNGITQLPSMKCVSCLSQMLTFFCIVSSDCDFTKMTIAMRGRKKTVVEFGSSDTPIRFQNACERFDYIENLIKEPLKKNKINEYKL